MNIPQAQIISQITAEKLLTTTEGQKMSIHYRKDKHQLVVESGQEWVAKIYLPWTMDWSENRKLKEKADAHFALVLIRSGQAVVGYFHRGELIDHKVLRAYMVRQKQGFSQIKYLKTKGKSRAGSRVRLAETERFFEEINERLNSYSDKFPIDFWGISCAKTIWPYYFNSSISAPFSPQAENLIELPVHIPQTSLEVLKSVGNLLQNFHLILSEKGKQLVGSALEFVEDSDEDW